MPTPIIHYKGESTKKGSLRYVRIFYEAMLIFFEKHYPHYSKGYYLAVKFSIFFRALLAAAHRIVFRPFRRRQGEGDKRERGEWYILSREPDRVAGLIPGTPCTTTIESMQQLPAPRKGSPLRYIVLDSGLLTYRQIIDIVQQECHDRNRFLIYNPQAQVIVSPKEIHTRP